MNLKKSDKLIALVGVIILIAAAVGIVLYTLQPKSIPTTPPKEMKKYSVEWIEKPGQIADITEFASKKEPYTGQFIIETKPGSVITNVDVQVIWQDDVVTKFALFRKGEDTLTATINSPTGESKIHSEKGSGNETLSFSINSKPSDEIIEDVETISDAESIVLENYDGMNTVSFDYEVKVDVGEKLLSFRPLKLLNYFRDKGNDFTFKVTYTYYEANIQEYGTPPQSGEESNNQQNYMGTQTWNSMAYPGKN